MKFECPTGQFFTQAWLNPLTAHRTRGQMRKAKYAESSLLYGPFTPGSFNPIREQTANGASTTQRKTRAKGLPGHAGPTMLRIGKCGSGS